MEQELNKTIERLKNRETERLTKLSEESNQEKQTTTMMAYGTEATCPLCKGNGWMFLSDDTVKECECGLLDKQRHEGRLKFASIPGAYKDVTLKDLTAKHYVKPESKAAFKAIAKSLLMYLDNLYENIENGKGIYFWSTTKGSGKTMLAAALANTLINDYHRYVKFATSLDILDEIRATYNRHDENESDLLKDLATSEFLVIDDFGTERATDWAGEKFYQIVNKRYINKKVTFYTSNYDLRTLKYDDRITNRIKERSYIAHFPEESVREVIAKRENDWGLSE